MSEGDYWERPTAVPGVTLWSRTVSAGGERSMILPDGCMDLIWNGRHLLVAGPDSTARWHESPAGTSFVGLRFSAARGPAVLGVRADELLDQAPELAALWGSGPARELSERAAEEPLAALERWLERRVRRCPPDGLGPLVFSLAALGTPVAEMAEQAGLGPRHLLRRCLPLFGYGPRRLGRVLRLGRAVERARAGWGWADVAAECGYADQAHLTREVRDLTGVTPATLLRLG